MITRCNQCGTKFEISAQLLNADDPTVRCGECMAVFDARAELVDETTDDVPLLTKTASNSGPGGRAENQASDDPLRKGSLESNRQQAALSAQYAIEPADLETADTLVIERSFPVEEPSDSGREYAAVAQSGESRGYRPDFEIETSQAQAHIDPVISRIDDESMAGSLEFEKTLALDGLTGIESSYQERGAVIADQQHHAVAGNGHQSMNVSYSDDMGANNSPPHQSGSRAPQAYQYEDEIQVTLGERDRPVQIDESEPVFDQSYHLDELSQPAARSPAAYHDSSYRAQREMSGRRANATVSDRHGSSSGASYPRSEEIPGEDMVSAELAESPGLSNNSAIDETDEYNPESARDMHRHIRNRGGTVQPTVELTPPVAEEKARGIVFPLICALLLGCALLYGARNSIANLDWPEPVLSTFCSVAGCQLPTSSDVSRLELMRRRMYDHPTLDNVIVISVDMVNRAPFPQPYPVLAITMANSEGTPVANRDFLPAQYQPPEVTDQLLPAGKPVRIKFEVVDPGVDAQSFELEFRQQAAL